jgi:predicted acylesterase/phospholipase RssA
LLGAQQIALRSIINAKLKLGVPDCLLRPNVGHFPSLDFARMDEILAASADAKEEAAKTLAQLNANAKLS